MSSVEDPEKILDQAVEDMQGDLIRLRQAAAEVTASEKRMQAKYEQAQKTAVRFHLPTFTRSSKQLLTSHGIQSPRHNAGRVVPPSRARSQQKR